MKWFGNSWGAPVCEPEFHIPTPVGKECAGHEHLHPLDGEEIIKADDQGVMIPHQHPASTEWLAWHLDCWLHEIGADRLG